MARILMVLSGADSLTLADSTIHSTGFWAEEVVSSHRLLRAAGHDIVLATPGGVRPTVDEISLDQRGGVAALEADGFRAYLASIDSELRAPLNLALASAEDYDGVFIPGGHAPMADLATDRALGRFLTAADERGAIVAALCHGLAALLSATTDEGVLAFAGRNVTAFSDAEEAQGGLGEQAPFLVESALRAGGVLVTPGPAWSNKVVVDRNLITGQNPQSSTATAAEVVKALAAA